MKQIKTMMAGLLIGSAIFTACNKSAYDIAPLSTTSPNSHARLSANSSLVQFRSGNLQASHILIRGSGNPIVDLRGAQSFDLFQPLAVIGLPVHAGKFAPIETTLEIAPADANSALRLEGVWQSVDEAGNTGEAVPVEFLINTPHRLFATLPLLVINDQSNLLELLSIRLDGLSKNFPQEMLRDAVDPATGRILISQQQNPVLYDMMLRNLGEMLQVQAQSDDDDDDGNTGGPGPVSESDAADPRSQQM